MTQVREAKRAAQAWVQEIGAQIDGFAGAFLHGSILTMADDDALPATSDVDVMVVFDGLEPPDKPGKFRYQGTLLEVSTMPFARVASPEQVLGDYHLAGSFRRPGLLADPTGHLAPMQAAVQQEFTRRIWVRRRCDHAARNSRAMAQGLDPAARWPDQVTGWLFANGVLCHVLLVAGLQNPTVRRRYRDARDLLARHRRRDVYAVLLELLGGAAMTPAQAEGHLDDCAAAFDAAKVALQSPYRFAADLTDLARPVAIDGSRALIAQGDHREALFWIAATFSRCLAVLTVDAPPEVVHAHRQGYDLLCAALGIHTFADLQRRAADVVAFLPRLRAVAETIMDHTEEIEDP